VPAEGVGLGRRVALALARTHMEQRGAGARAQPGERIEQCMQVVAVYRADIAPAEGSCVATHVASAVQSAQIWGDRHPVVVEDDAQPGAEVAGVVQRFEGHAGGRGAVADHRDGHLLTSSALEGLRHAECGGDGCARVTGTEGVVGTLRAAQEARGSVGALDAIQGVSPAGESLVSVRLVTDVPHDPVARRVEDSVQRDRQLDCAETASEVAADPRAELDEM